MAHHVLSAEAGFGPAATCEYSPAAEKFAELMKAALAIAVGYQSGPLQQMVQQKSVGGNHAMLRVSGLSVHKLSVGSFRPNLSSFLVYFHQVRRPLDRLLLRSLPKSHPLV
jgi:hypothetical protein